MVISSTAMSLCIVGTDDTPTTVLPQTLPRDFELTLIITFTFTLSYMLSNTWSLIKPSFCFSCTFKYFYINIGSHNYYVKRFVHIDEPTEKYYPILQLPWLYSAI